MATTTPQQGFPIPTDSDTPNITGDMSTLANAIEKRVFGVYNSTSDRDTKVTSPQEGQFAYVKDTDKTYYYSGSAWVLYPPAVPAFTSGSTVPSNSSGSDGDVFFKV